mgnify:CR=1 FL=1
MAAFIFLAKSKRFIPIANSYFGVQLELGIIAIGNTGYLFGSLLDIVILIERLALFIPSFKRLSKTSPFKIVAFLLFITFAINWPMFISYNTTVIEANLNSSYSNFFYTFKPSNFLRNDFGQFIALVSYIFRDILTLVLLILFNIISCIHLRRCLRQKAHLTRGVVSALKSISKSRANNSSDSNMNGASMEAQKFLDSNLTRTRNNNSSSINSLSFNYNLIDKKSIIMVITLCTISVVEHLIISACVSYFIYKQDIMAYVLIFLANFFGILKELSNFFVYYFFNSLFRKKTNSLFNKQ